MNRKPAHDVMDPPSASQTFGLLTAVFLGAIYGLSVFWSLLTAKPKTVGLKAYWLDYFIGFFVLVALCTCQKQPDRLCFQISFALLNVMFWFHIVASLFADKHVLLHCVGQRSRWLEGVAFAVVFILNATANTWVFTFFVLISAAAQMIRDGMIKARDKIRAANMADAIAQQQYQMDQYNGYRHGQS